MRFRLTSNAFIELPTVIDDGGHRYTKRVHTRITHEDGSPITTAEPRDMDFPKDLPLDSVSRTWEALDDEAKALQGKLSKMGQVRPVIHDAASALAALEKLPKADREAVAAALAGKAK